MNEKFCQECGSKISAESKFCEHCGAVQEYFPNVPQDTVAPAPKKKSAFKIWGPIVAGVLVLAVAASALFIFKPFGVSDSKDSKETSGGTDNSSASYSDLVTAMSDTFAEGSLSFDIEVGTEIGGENMEISAECRAVTDKDSSIGTLWMDMDIEGDVEGENMDIGGDVLIYDDKMYFYSNGSAYIQELDLDSLMSSYYAGGVDIPDDVDLENFTWDDFYDLLDEMGVLEDFEETVDAKKFEGACVDALDIIESEIKIADKSGKTVYTFDVNLNDLAEEILKEFKDAVKDEDVFAEIEEGLEEIPDIDVLFEITVNKDYVSAMKLEISSDEFEMYLNFSVYDVGTTEIEQSEIDDFVKKCEENNMAEDYYGDYSEDYYYEEDYYNDNFVVEL